ncbi:MAG: hypothetical protein Q9161_003797 [Pseudevernia consocians]
MPVLLFHDVAYFFVKDYRPVKNPRTGRITYECVGRKWVKCNLYDPVQREHAHNYYLSLCPDVSQEDKDKVASEWADIRHVREAKEKRREEKKKQEAKKKLEEEKQEEEKNKNIDAMVEENEGVAMNIAKVEKSLKAAEGKKAAPSWMDVVMG